MEARRAALEGTRVRRQEATTKAEGFPAEEEGVLTVVGWCRGMEVKRITRKIDEEEEEGKMDFDDELLVGDANGHGSGGAIHDKEGSMAVGGEETVKDDEDIGFSDMEGEMTAEEKYHMKEKGAGGERSSTSSPSSSKENHSPPTPVHAGQLQQQPQKM